MISFYWFKLDDVNDALYSYCCDLNVFESFERKQFISRLSLNLLDTLNCWKRNFKYLNFRLNMHTRFLVCATLLCFNWPVVNEAEQKNKRGECRTNPMVWRWSRSMSANLANPHVVQILLLIVSHNFQYFLVWSMSIMEETTCSIVELHANTYLQDCLRFHTLFPCCFFVFVVVVSSSYWFFPLFFLML